MVLRLSEVGEDADAMVCVVATDPSCFPMARGIRAVSAGWIFLSSPWGLVSHARPPE